MEPRQPAPRRDLSPAERERLLAALHRRAEQSATGRTIPRRSRRPQRQDEEAAPLSFAQQRLWFLDALLGTSPAYNIAFSVELAGGLDTAALAAALTEVVRRHEVLRTTFELRDEQPVQVVSPVAHVALPVVDLQALARASAAAESDRLASAAAGRPFDLRRGPLLCALLLRVEVRSCRLVLTLHHIVSDGWSSGILARELGLLYRAFAAGEPSPLPPLAIQFADYAVWQRDRLAGDTLASEAAYWHGQLAPPPPVLALPADRPRPAVARLLGRLLPFALAPDLAAAVRRLGRGDRNGRNGRNGRFTPFMVLLAAFQLLLIRLSGQDDVVVGSPVANRNRPETEPLIGCFVNLLALRLAVAGNPSFGEVLERVSASTLAGHEHQEMPFEKLIQDLGLERNLSHNPLVQAVFVFQNTPAGAVQAGGDLSLRQGRVASGTSKFDLTLALGERGEILEGGIESSLELFDPATVARWLGAFERLLAAAVADPGAGFRDLPLLAPAEAHQLVREWSGDGARCGVAALPRLFAAVAAGTPDAVALTAEGQVVTYGELDRRANRLARRLRGLGVGPEILVGLFLERSVELVTAVLAVLRAGGAYLPLDLGQPAERLALLLGDSGVSWLLTARAGAQPPTLPGTVRQLDASAAGAEEDEEDGGALGIESDPDALAYVIYTSGSTGVPKGIGVSHANVARLFAATEPWYGFGPDDVWTLFHSYAFDFSVWELWGPLLHGGRLVVVPYEVSRNPADLHRLLAAEEVTVLNQTPSAFTQLVLADGAVPPLTALRWVIFGGEALELERLAPWLARYGDHRPRLVNMYGITETTVHVTFRPIRAGDLGTLAGASPIGTAIPDLDLALLDPALRPVPIGVAGEICVGGPGLARGYLGRPGLTAERFVPHPFAARPGERLYRSGDLARRRADGEVVYLGRIDHQVKIRGFRIELGEIEAALAKIVGVATAVVVALAEAGAAGQAEGQRLVAYVVPAEGHALAAHQLREALQQKLPAYMVPSAFVQLSALPLTANGKLDPRRLPTPDGGREERGGTYVAPRTLAEEVLCAVLSQVLGIDEVGTEDNLFALGADSIRNLRILERARERGLALTLPDLFQYQTVAGLAAVAAQRGAGSEPPVTAPFSLLTEQERERLPADVEDAYPLTELQQGMLYHMVLTPDEPLYQNVDSWLLRGRFDASCFQQAVDRVVARHPFLRTSFDFDSSDRPLQRVHRSAELPVEVEDLSDLGTAEQEAALDALLVQHRARPFDLKRPPQMRFHVALHSPDTFQFTLTENHAVVDGWSLHSTLAEIFEIHFQLLAGETPPALPPLPLTFRDYVHRERLALASPEAEAFWTALVRDAPPLELPGRVPPATSTGPRPRKAGITLPEDLVAGLRSLARELSVPFKSLLLAAYAQGLGFLSGRTDVLSGLVTNGRLEEPGGDQLRGLFLNTMPFRLQLDAADWTQLVRRTLEVEMAMLPHRRYPLAALQRTWGRGALFGVAFNFIHFHVMQPLFAAGKLEVVSGRGAEGASLDLIVHFVMAPEGRRLDVRLEYDSQRWSPDEALQMAGRFRACLAALVADPRGRCLDFVPLSDEERHQLLCEWQGGAAAASGGARCLTDLLAAQAARTPEAVAVVVPSGGRLSYRELDGWSGAIAARLRRLGVGPETVVGLCVDRSPTLVAALLGILKAGGAYLPLDPAYPARRLADMVADAGVQAVVTVERLSDGLRGLVPQVVVIGPPEEAAGEEPPALPALQPANLAYVLYTSGSTGRPKGVALTHGNAAAFVQWAGGACSAAELQGVLAATSISFDLSVFELLATLCAGGTLVLARSALELPDLGTAEVRTLNTVPSVLAELTAAGDLPRSVRLINLAGEPLRRELVDTLHRMLPAARVVNLYGPTEDTTYSTVAPQNRGAAAAPTLGRPLPGKRLHLLDPALRQVVPGGVGEICLGGHGLARGYHGRPELTAERFVPDPFATLPGERLYRTGDLGRHRPDGEVELLGRLDQQVKLRGFRIEPGEIETQLALHPAVRSCAVVVRRDDARGPRLAAYVVAAGETAEREELRSWLRSRLPEHMVPASFSFLPALPALPNGKLNRRALPAPELDGEGEHAVPRGELEESVAAVWRELLGLAWVGRDDNFFDLGGHSLLLIQLRRRLNEQLGRGLSMLDMFRYTTVAALAERLGEGAAPVLPAALPAPSAPDAQREAGKDRLRRRLERRVTVDDEEMMR